MWRSCKAAKPLCCCVYNGNEWHLNSSNTISSVSQQAALWGSLRSLCRTTLQSCLACDPTQGDIAPKLLSEYNNPPPPASTAPLVPPCNDTCLVPVKGMLRRGGLVVCCGVLGCRGFCEVLQPPTSNMLSCAGSVARPDMLSIFPAQLNRWCFEYVNAKGPCVKRLLCVCHTFLFV